MRRRRRRLRRRRDRARASSSGWRRSRRGRPSCPGRAQDPGPGDRPGHRLAIQSGTIFGYQALAAGLLERVRRELAEAAGVAPSDVKAILTGGPLGGAVGAGAPRHRRDRPGAHAQGARHPPRRSRRRRPPRAGAAVTGPARRAGSIGLGVTGSIAAYKAVELLRLLLAEGADVAVLMTPSGGPVRRAADVRDADPAAGRDGAARAAARRPDRSHRRRPTAPTRSSSHRRPRSGSARWRTGCRRRRHGDLPRLVGAGRRRAGDGRRHVDAIRRRAPTSRGCARLRLHDRRARGRAAGVGQTAVGRLAELPRDRRRGRRGDRRRGRSAQPDPAARPPLVDAGPRRGPRGPARRRDRRRDTRADRSGALHRQPLDRPDGRRGRGGGARPRGAGDADRGQRRGARCPTAPTIVRVESTAELRAALLRVTHAPTARRVSTPWSWPPPSPTSGRRPAADDASSSAAAALTLELEPTPDILAEVGRIAHGLDSEGAPPRAARPRPVLVGFAAETGSLERAADKAVARASTCSSPTTCRAGLRVRHGHQPRHDPRRGRRAATTCRC